MLNWMYEFFSCILMKIERARTFQEKKIKSVKKTNALTPKNRIKDRLVG